MFRINVFYTINSDMIVDLINASNKKLTTMSECIPFKLHHEFPEENCFTLIIKQILTCIVESNLFTIYLKLTTFKHLLSNYEIRINVPKSKKSTVNNLRQEMNYTRSM